jgi:plastocyanin
VCPSGWRVGAEPRDVQQKVAPRIALGIAVAVVSVVAAVALGAFSSGGVTRTPRRAETTRVAISIRGLAFERGSRTMTVGTTVTWQNRDHTTHTVTAADGSFDSGPIQPGEIYSVTFTGRGAFEYLCTIDPFMKGTIRVVLPYGLEPG